MKEKFDRNDNAAESTYYIDGKRAFTGYDCVFFLCMDQAELGKALAEKFGLGKYKEMSDQGPGVNGIKDVAQNAVSEEKNEVEHTRFGIPAWLENKAFRAYEEWLNRPLSERKPAGGQR